MLSALIPSIHSYPAIHLVAKPADQRYVQPSPLVDTPRITTCSDYIFTPSPTRSRVSAFYSGSKTTIRSFGKADDQVVTGSNQILFGRLPTVLPYPHLQKKED